MIIEADSVAHMLSRHLPIYRLRKPIYQTVMLQALAQLWTPGFRRVLDVGGGTGVIAQAVKEFFDVDRVVSVDVADRYLPGLTIEHRTYDGRSLPFDAGAFDCVMFNNVIHHVSVSDRAALLAECRRVAPRGGLLIKDHVAVGSLDHARLAALDLIGNAPFAGMISAHYLTDEDWRALASEAGFTIEAAVSGAYRGPLFAAVFPNRLEMTMRWRPTAA
jgi:ubiquinone/menaquinone biosynthesis C-methylase UbiE